MTSLRVLSMEPSDVKPSDVPAPAATGKGQINPHASYFTDFREIDVGEPGRPKCKPTVEERDYHRRLLEASNRIYGPKDEREVLPDDPLRRLVRLEGAGYRRRVPEGEPEWETRYYERLWLKSSEKYGHCKLRERANA